MELRPGTPKEAGMLPERIDRTRDLCAGWVKEGITPSLVVLVARRGIIVLHEAFGKLRSEANAPPVDPDSVFALASLTKPVTATLTLTLVEDGLLGLNRPVIDYIPEACGEGVQEVLVHHCLTHTTGFRDDNVIPRLLMGWGKSDDLPPRDPTQHPILHEASHLTRDVPISTPPGEQMCYCNHNYETLAEIVRRVSGRSIEDYARERLFDPLGMSDTYYVVPESVEPRIVKRPPDAFMAEPMGPFMQGLDSRQLQDTPYGGLGGFSTARDMAIFAQMFLNRGTYGSARILSPASVAEMTRNQIPGIPAEMPIIGQSFPEASWGFGWSVQSNGKWKYYNGSLLPPSAFHHGGGAGTMLWVDPVNEIVGVYLSVVTHRTLADENIWNVDLFQNVVTASVED
jgi:CubicO group peptidase (beta-lactamase class C family)